MRIAQGLGLGTRLPDQPQPSRLGDLARAPRAGQVIQRADGADRCGSSGIASHPLRIEAKPGCGFTHAPAGCQLPGEMKRILERDALPRWRARSIAEITRGDIVEGIETIVERGSPVA